MNFWNKLFSRKIYHLEYEKVINNPNNEFNFQEWLKEGHNIYSDYADSTKAVYNPNIPDVPMFEKNAFESGYTQEYEDAKYKAYIDAGGTPENYVSKSMGDMRKLHFSQKLADHAMELLYANRGGEVSREDMARWDDVSMLLLENVPRNKRWGKNLGSRPLYLGEGEDQICRL